jgi:hypothetical protein
MFKSQFVFYGIEVKIHRIENFLGNIFLIIFLLKYFFNFINYLPLDFYSKTYIDFSMKLKNY